MLCLAENKYIYYFLLIQLFCFLVILYFNALLKSFEKIQVWLQPGKLWGTLGEEIMTYYVADTGMWSLTTRERTSVCVSVAEMLTVIFRFATEIIQTKWIRWQRVLKTTNSERTTTLRYTYVAYPVSSEAEYTPQEITYFILSIDSEKIWSK